MPSHVGPFLNSFTSSTEYPCNLLDKQTYAATLTAHNKRLRESAQRLCASSESDASLPFRDFDDNTSRFKETYYIGGIDELNQFLGYQSNTSQHSHNQPTTVFSQRDPKCRFIFPYAQHSRARLHITMAMLVKILTYHQVMPAYLDFIMLFGQSNNRNSLRYSGFCEQTSLDPGNADLSMDYLGRSGRHFELCYNLKTVDLNPDILSSAELKWSVRQASIYHKFDVVEGTALWIITKGSLDLKNRVQQVTGNNGRQEDRTFNTPAESFRASLAIHMMTVHWAGESWRWYIQWLEELIEKETELVLYGTREKNATYRKRFEAGDLQKVQMYEDWILETSMTIESNIEVIAALQEFYEGLLSEKHFPLKASSQGLLGNFSKQLKNAMYDLRMQGSRARLLIQQASGRKALILQHLQDQTADHMEKLTRTTLNVGISAQKEAVAMKIITVVTLVYLPATFVSTFFSTDIVKYQPQGDNGSNNLTISSNSQTSFSDVAMYRWLQVSIPLTLTTLFLAWIGYRRERKRQDKWQISPVDTG